MGRGRQFAISLTGVCASAFALAQTPQMLTNADEAHYQQILEQGKNALLSGKPQSAITQFDQIITVFQQRYPTNSGLFCSHFHPQESQTLARLKLKGLTLVPGFWCDALYLKAYALIDQDNPEEGTQLLRRVVALEPTYAQYSNELGHIESMRKDWPAALAAFKAAEADAEQFASADQIAMRSRACRGIGYVEVEMNKLDQAEATYYRCLLIDPNDVKSINELHFVEQRKRH